jgi:hypothetical protein
MMQKDLSKVEITGSIVAIGCAIHCISIPVLLSLGSAGAVHWLDHIGVELLFLVSTMIIAGWSIFGSLRQKRVNATPITLFSFGFLALLISIVFHAHVLSAVGGIFLATAHIINWRQLRTCQIAR